MQQRTSGKLIPLFGEVVNDVPEWGTHPPAPSRKKRRGEETESENVFIEGENLEVLKILQKSYFGKIKLFESKKIRSVWNEHEQKWYFSFADVVEALTDSADVKQYIKKLR